MTRLRGPARARAAGVAGALLVGAAAPVAVGLGLGPAAHASDPLPGLGGELVQNGSFEQPSVAYGSYATLAAVPGWTLPAGQPLEIQNHAAGGGDAADGEQFAELDANVRTTATQLLTTVPGSVYALSFAYTPRPDVPLSESEMYVSWNGTQIADLKPTTAVSAPTWQTIVLPVTATGTSSTVSFSAGGTDDSFGPYLDNVSVRALSCRTTSDGSWQDPSIWDCPVPGSADLHVVPGAGNDVVVENVVTSSDPAAAKELLLTSGSQLGVMSGSSTPALTVTGNVDLEGTLFSLLSNQVQTLNLSTTQAVQQVQVSQTTGASAQDSQLAMIQLQAMVTQSNQSIDLLTNLISKFESASMSIVNNISASAAPVSALRAAAVDDQAAVPTLTLTTNLPVTLGGLTVGPGTALNLGSSTSLTLDSFLHNNGSISVPANSNLLLSSSAMADGSGSFADGTPAQVGAVQNQSVVVGGTASVSAAVSDSPLDTLTGTWSWGDGTTSDAVLDLLSGAGTASGQHRYAKVGDYSVSLTIRDAAGNISTGTATQSVGYGFAGFFDPVDNGLINTAKAGRTIPLKWRLTDASGAPVTDLSAVRVTATGGSCGSGGTDAIEQYADGSSGLQNLGNGYYQYNWSTPKSYAGSCRTIAVDLGEGSPTTPVLHTALFQFN